MKKKILLSIAIGLAFLYYKVNTKSELEKKKSQYEKFIEEHPFNTSMYLTKKERWARGLPPNAYFEQEYLNEINPNTGRTYPENIFKIQKELNSLHTLRKSPGDNSNPWVERGPNNVGGRTRALLFDPNDNTNKRVFAGGVSGGLWVNNDITNANSSWQQVGVSENVSITCITVDPNNSQIMYVGTGESQTSAGPGNGVWKSTDGGNTWVNVFRNDADTNIRNRFYYINDILAWNNNGNTEIFIGVAGNSAGFGQFPGANVNGLYKSVNGGNSWSAVSGMPTISGINPQNFSAQYEPTDIKVGIDNAIWVSTDLNIWGEGGGTILKSTDGNNFVVKHTITDGQRTEIALSKQNKNKIFVLASSGSSQPIKMIKTEDEFATTSNLSLPDDADNGIPTDDFTRGQASYDLVLEVDPSNDNILYAGGIDLFRSSNSGTSWNQISKWSNNNNLSNLNVPQVHADQHGFTFHPTDANKAIIGNDGGVYYAISLTGSEAISSSNNNSIQPREKNYNTTQFYHGAIGENINADLLLAGTQDNGTPFINTVNTTNVSASIEVYGGDGAYSFIDKDGEYMIASYIYNDKVRLNLPYDGGGVILDQDDTTGSFINPQELDDNLDILYANGHKFATDSSPETYDSIVRYKGIKPLATLEKDKIGNSLLNSTVTAMKVSPYTTSSTTLFVGLRNGIVLKIENADSENDNSIIWTEIGQGIPVFGGSISSINFGDNENKIYVTYHNYGINNIWYSSNGGNTWQNKEGDLPDIPVKAILQNPLNENEVIIGTELGVWRTDNFQDSAPNWVQSYNGMSNVKVTALDLRKADNTVLATTFGRGMFTGKFTNATASIGEVIGDSDVFTVYPSITKGEFTVFAKSSIGSSKLNIFDISGKKVFNTQLDFSGREKQKVSINVNSGVYFVNLITDEGIKSSKKIIIE